MINFIVEDRIARPKNIADLYNKLPEPSRKAIEERDKTQMGKAHRDKDAARTTP